MIRHNANNERIKRQYFAYMKEAQRQSEPSVDAAAAAIARFEAQTKYRDFKGFHFEQAVAFKRHLAAQRSSATDNPLSKATLNSTLAQLRRFFFWLADQPGYKSRLKYSDSDYFNLSEKEARIATARRPRPVPTLEQLHHVLSVMPAGTELEWRNRAVVAFTLLTGARVNATASIKLKHVDLSAGSVFQDARDVRTKFSKTFITYFCPVGGEALAILEGWVTHLRTQLLWGNEDPLFPATRTRLGVTGQWETAGLLRDHWSGATPIRAIFKAAFEAAGLPYFNPHSVRSTLGGLGGSLCRTAEEYKAWSQNLGHEGVLTTFYSYGQVATSRQGEIIQGMGQSQQGHSTDPAAAETLQNFVRKLQTPEVLRALAGVTGTRPPAV